jgi:hypothetical protein
VILGGIVARITVPGFSKDMYYLGKLDATLPISMNRLDYDDVLRTLSILKIVSDMLAPHSGSRRMTMRSGPTTDAISWQARRVRQWHIPANQWRGNE